MTTPVPTAVDFPARRVRFTGGRTWHRTRRPAGDWYGEELEAACGQRGWLARGTPGTTPRDCAGCARALAHDETEAA